MKKCQLIAFLILIISSGVWAQSTSPNFNSFPEFLPPRVLPEESSDIITFSEYPLGTSISTQYKNIGIIFGGSGPFISTDGANPTSPVLSGTPRFQGDITGTFVKPDTDIPTVVQSFTFDAGYFDEIGSTRIEWFDPDGVKLGQRINSHFGIESFTIEGGNIASWRISIVENEPAGYAIDNVSFVPVSSSILFREKNDGEKDGTWGFGDDEIPGFDHVGFHTGNVVYESHPGYPSGTYVSSDGNESIFIASENGVQWQHSRATFEHDAMSTGTSPVIDFEEIPIAEDLATQMQTKIESVGNATFQFIDFSSLSGIQATLSPAAQKGGGGTFTCVGLVEWAAEQAGHRGGQGFIPNNFESFMIPDPSNPTQLIELPLLSPQLLNYAMKGQNLLQDAKQWVLGLFDPVDFIVTDPLGRRLGFVNGVGLFNEIPNAFYSGDGGLEQILIPTAIPGPYTIQFIGTGDDVYAQIAALGASVGFTGFLEQGQIANKEFFVDPMPASTGDVDGDGDVDQDDVAALIPQLNQFTNGLGHPGDIDGDGLLSSTDLDLLIELVDILASQPTIQPFVILAVDQITLQEYATVEGDMHSNTNAEYKSNTLHNGSVSAVNIIEVHNNAEIVGSGSAASFEYKGNASSSNFGGGVTITTVAPENIPEVPPFNAGSEDIELEHGGFLSLAPGSYGKIKVQDDATLNLSSGEYFIKSLVVGKRSIVNLDVNAGPVDIYIEDELSHIRDSKFYAIGGISPTNEVTIWVASNRSIKLRERTIFNGCNLIAPFAEVKVQKNAFFKGVICARSVDVQKHATVVGHNSSATPENKGFGTFNNYGDDLLHNSVSAIPANYELYQNYPNPFNPRTTIRFGIPRSGEVSLKIYNIRGQLVRTLVNGYFESGYHIVNWDTKMDNGSYATSGIYFYQILSGNFQMVKKMVLLK